MSSLDEQMYKNKYLKYKNKYIQLKEYQAGGIITYDTVYIFAHTKYIDEVKEIIDNGLSIDNDNIKYIYKILNYKGYKIYKKKPKLLELITITNMSETAIDMARKKLTKKAPEILFTKYVKDILSCVNKIYNFTNIINYNIKKGKFNNDDDLGVFSIMYNNQKDIIDDLNKISKNQSYKDITMEIPVHEHLINEKIININYNDIETHIEDIKEIVKNKLKIDNVKNVTYIQIVFTNMLKTKGQIFYE